MKYSETHEWIKVEKEAGTVGVTDYAQAELGDIVYVELPQVGQEVKAGEEAAVLESTKAAADVYSPVSGKIVAVNDSLDDAPELINTSSERDGWIFKIALSHAEELEKLLDGEQYQSSIK